MDSKRERKPNVRLGEIGDFPAAFRCVFTPRLKGNSIRKRRNPALLDPDKPEIGLLSEEVPLGFSDFNPAGAVSLSVDPMQYRENENPNSPKLHFESAFLGEIEMSKPELNFGAVTRKCRVMKRRCRSATGSSRVFASSWGFRYSSEAAYDDGKVPEGFAKDFSFDEVNELSGRGTSALSGEETDDVSTGCGMNDTSVGRGKVDGVTKWLVDSGFGRYANLFEIHEVDEETLPLLTVQDLVEMGVHAVGPRRKLYNAIQQLAGDSG